MTNCGIMFGVALGDCFGGLLYLRGSGTCESANKKSTPSISVELGQTRGGQMLHKRGRTLRNLALGRLVRHG